MSFIRHYLLCAAVFTYQKEVNILKKLTLLPRIKAKRCLDVFLCIMLYFIKCH